MPVEAIIEPIEVDSPPPAELTLLDLRREIQTMGAHLFQEMQAGERRLMANIDAVAEEVQQTARKVDDLWLKDLKREQDASDRAYVGSLAAMALAAREAASTNGTVEAHERDTIEPPPPEEPQQ
jgi:hypothetical protein